MGDGYRSRVQAGEPGGNRRRLVGPAFQEFEVRQTGQKGGLMASQQDSAVDLGAPVIALFSSHVQNR